MQYSIIVLATALLVNASASDAQSLQFAFRPGAGTVAEDSHIGFSGTVDVKFGGAPLALSPTLEFFSGQALSRTYYGVNLMLMKDVLKTGLHAGLGVGGTNWSFAGTSRSATIIDVTVGGRLQLMNHVGLFVDAKFKFNQKTSSDTDVFNRSSERGFREPVPAFLFDNDLVVNFGVVLVAL